MSTEANAASRLPFVSVVVPVFNGQRTIAACVKALLAQSYPKERYEIIVVDNNSIDDTPAIVSRYPVQLVFEPRVQTSYAARNTGLAAARGEIVAFTDADCLAHPDWLVELTRPFADPQVVGVRGKVASDAPASLVEQFTHQADPLGVEHLGGRLSMITANAAYRRDILEQVGGFRSEMFTGADVDLGWRVQQLPGARVVYAGMAVVNHKHRTTLSGLRRQYQRYGFSEVMLDALYRGQSFYSRSPRRQLVTMARQAAALVRYLLSFIYRVIRSLLTGWDRQYVFWPLLWLAADGSNLLGKIQALIQTRFFTRHPARGGQEVLQ